MIYFNNNATSYPKPENVLSAVNNYLASIPESPYRSGFKTKSVVEGSREKVADFFHVEDSNNVIFTSGSTEALNLAIFGLEKPKHIITTTIEHNSVIRPLKKLEKENGVKLTFVGCDQNGFIDPYNIEKEITKATSAIVLNHCSNVTGSIQDIETVSRIARQNKIPFIVDASQSAGAVKIDLQSTPVDMLAFTGHKALFATTGIGGLILNPEIKLEPLKVGGTGIRSDYPYQPESPLPLYYEAGTHNLLGIAALSAGIDYINKNGIEKLHLKKTKIYHTIINNLKNNNSVTFFGGLDLKDKIPVINFRVKDLSPDDTAYILNGSFDIIVRSGLHCAPLIHKTLGSFPEGTVRASFSSFNTEDEANTFVEAINQITGS